MPITLATLVRPVAVPAAAQPVRADAAADVLRWCAAALAGAAVAAAAAGVAWSPALAGAAVAGALAGAAAAARRRRAQVAGGLIDPVTGVPGREALRLRLGAEVSRARRHGTALTVLHVDLAGFRALQARVGPGPTGELLRRIALGMAAEVRGEDLVARRGGDSFVVVLPGLEEEDATRVAMRLSAVAARVRVHGIDGPPPRLDIGIASYPDAGTDVDGLLAAARRSLDDVRAARLAAAEAARPATPGARATRGPAPAWPVAAALRREAVALAAAVAAWFALPLVAPGDAVRRALLLVTFAAVAAAGGLLAARTRGRERVGWTLFLVGPFVTLLPHVAVLALTLVAAGVLLIAGDGWLRDRFRILDAAVFAALVAATLLAFALPSRAAVDAVGAGEHVALALRAAGAVVAGAVILLVVTSVPRRARPDVWMLAAGSAIPIAVSFFVLRNAGAWTPPAPWKVVYVAMGVQLLAAMWLRLRHRGEPSRALRDGEADAAAISLVSTAGYVAVMVAAAVACGGVAPAVVVALVVVGLARSTRAAIVARDNRRLTALALRSQAERAAQHHASLLALTAALAARDGYTGRHTEETTALVSRVAAALGLGPEERREVDTVALLHDIGKIGTPNEILHKDGPLDEREWEIMRQHPVIGERILSAVPGLESIARAVRHEHERWDGRGYPDGLAGEEIPLASRIVLVCDAYHAMTSDRPYRAAMAPEDAIAELRRHAGTQFDPAVVNALIDVLGEDEPDRVEAETVAA